MYDVLAKRDRREENGQIFFANLKYFKSIFCAEKKRKLSLLYMYIMNFMRLLHCNNVSV